jgi:protein TonB
MEPPRPPASSPSKNRSLWGRAFLASSGAHLLFGAVLVLAPISLFYWKKTKESPQVAFHFRSVPAHPVAADLPEIEVVPPEEIDPVLTPADPLEDPSFPTSSLTSFPDLVSLFPPKPTPVQETPELPQPLQDVGMTDPLPVAELCPPPRYPTLAKRRRWEGRARIWVKVGADGRPSGVGLAESSGYEILDRAAMEAVAKWVFQPALAKGEAVAGEVVVPIRFRWRRPS